MQRKKSHYKPEIRLNSNDNINQTTKKNQQQQNLQQTNNNNKENK